ncbi:EI24 domain-containing protein [Undibacterium sp.]|uniref:EI24 domain-containing protein n=1 Tax=Undibacterium sp. TaxID=1914977 RepID=UPI00374DB61A
MRDIMRAWGRALAAQFHYKIFLLTALPFVLSIVLWGVAMWWGLQYLVDTIQNYFVDHDGFQLAGRLLGMVGLIALKTVIVPLIAMWLLLPLMIVSSLLCIGVFAMPAINRYVSRRDYPGLEMRKGGSLLGSLWRALSSFVIFAVLWLVTLPLALIPVLSLIVQPLLWGWLTYRVMVYDALAEHADVEERELLTRRHRSALLAIGTIAGIFGAAPSLLWLGGVLSVVFLPVFAGLSIWLYLLVFVFTGLWFQYYCMEALQQLRARQLEAV